MRFQHHFSARFSDGIASNAPVQDSDPPHAPSTDLVIPPGHDLQTLYTLWHGSDAPLHLSLLSEEVDCSALLGDSLPREHQRLLLLLGDAARNRLEILRASPEALDEAVVVFLTRNELAAWLFLFPAVGQGRELSNNQIQQMLLRSNVTAGICWKTLRQLHELPNRHFRMIPIALGKAQVPGQDGRIVDHYPRSIDADVQVEALAHQDYESLHLVQDIEENDVICDIFPAVKGIPGATVTGRTLPATDGKPVTVPQGRNTRLSEDRQHLVAACRGHVVFTGRSFQVKPVLELEEADIKPNQTIKFLGDIHIHGDLPDGVSVCAIGTVQVDGVVGPCTMEAGENIIVSSGVQGQDRAVLHAQRSVYAKYLEHCSVYAVESVQADCIISCNVYSNGTVKARTGRGTIIGGTIRAATEIAAMTVGTKAECPTVLFLGGKPCEQAERMQVLREIEETERTIEVLSRSNDSADTLRLSKLRLNQCVAKMKLEKFDRDLEEYMAQSMADTNCRLICDTAYPGTMVTIHHTEFPVVQLTHPCVISASDGHMGRL